MDTLGPALQALLRKADADLTACERPVNLAVLAPGNNVVWDDCCGDNNDGGQVWVRVISVLPQPTTSQACDIDSLQVRAAVGVVRCMHCLDSEGNPPDTTQMEGDTLATTRDADTLMRSIQAWGGEHWEVPGVRQKGENFVNWKSLKIEQGLPLGPQGCCGGFEWTLTFSLTMAAGCTPVLEPVTQ